MSFLQPMLLDVNDYEIILRLGDDKMVYKTDVNNLVENSGVTIKNIQFPIEGYYLRLAGIGKAFSCGNILENLFIELKRENIENSLMVLDFDQVEELSENFYKAYTKILLETNNKIITINMNTQLSNEFSVFILNNIQEVEEE